MDLIAELDDVLARAPDAVAGAGSFEELDRVESSLIGRNSGVAEVRRVMQGPDGTVIYLAEVTYRGDYIHLEMDLKP